MRFVWFAVSAWFLVSSVILAGPGHAWHEAGSVALTIQPRQLHQLLDPPRSEPVTIVDLRDQAAHRHAHVPGARSVPAATLPQELTRLPRTGILVIYGETTLDAIGAYRRLQEAGFRNVRVLAGGLGQWVREGLPLEPR